MLDYHSEGFLKWSENDGDYQAALRIVKNNSEGRIWLIGGAVYRTLLFGDCDQAKDFDFIADYVRDDCDLFVPEGYSISRTGMGGLRLYSSNDSIDIVTLKDVFQIKSRGLEPSIKNYLSGVPLNIQSIVWDVGRRQIRGEIGIKAIGDRVLRVNDLEMAMNRAISKGMSIKQMLEEKAMELDFDYEMP